MLPRRVVLLEDRDPHHQPEKDALAKIGVEVLEVGDAVSKADTLGVCAAANGLVVPQVIARYGAATATWTWRRPLRRASRPCRGSA